MRIALLSAFIICSASRLAGFPDRGNSGVDDAQDVANARGDCACQDRNDDGRPYGGLVEPTPTPAA